MITTRPTPKRSITNFWAKQMKDKKDYNVVLILKQTVITALLVNIHNYLYHCLFKIIDIVVLSFIYIKPWRHSLQVTGLKG